MRFEELTSRVLGYAIEVHRHLGPGLLESAYEACLVHELAHAGLQFVRQYPVPVEYKGLRIDCGFRADLWIEGTLLVELKVVERLLPIHDAQLLTYMKLCQAPVGLLINFNVVRLKEGVRRFVV
ncbi:GxxExxY protein [Deferrisoma palaeochoriense]